MIEAYRIQRCMGDTGLGEIYACQNRDGDRAFIELIYRKYVEGLDLEVMRDAAARTALCKSHPAIPEVLGLVSLDKRPGILVRHYDGVDTPTLAAIEPPPVGAVLEMVAQVADALGHAWSGVEYDGKPLRWWHGDVRPPQIVIDEQGSLTLRGFGLLEALGGTDPTAVYTAFAYMSPELLLSQKHPHADIYALAMSAWELLTGEVLGLVPTAAAAASEHERIIAPRIEAMRKVGGERLADVFAQMLRWDPNDRPAHAEVVKLARAAGADPQALQDWARRTHAKLPVRKFSGVDHDPLVGKPASPIELGPPAPLTGHRFKRSVSKGTEPPARRTVVGGLDSPPRQASPKEAVSAILIGLGVGTLFGFTALGGIWWWSA